MHIFSNLKIFLKKLIKRLISNDSTCNKQKESILPIWSVLNEMINLQLMTKPKFLASGTSIFFGMLGLYVPYAYLPALARNSVTNLSEKDSDFLISIIGK